MNRPGTVSSRKKKSTGWRPRTDAQNFEFKKKVIENGEDKIDDHLATIQKAIEAAAGEVPHCTEAEGEKNTQGTPENVRLREEAAA